MGLAEALAREAAASRTGWLLAGLVVLALCARLLRTAPVRVLRGPGILFAAHLASPFKVYVLGFMPGLAYVAGLDQALFLPRRSQPRVRVPRSSTSCHHSRVDACACSRKLRSSARCRAARDASSSESVHPAMPHIP